MANCASQTLVNIERPCGGVKGGLATDVFVALRENVDFENIQQTDGVITALPLLNTAKFNRFEFNKNIVNYTSEAQYDSTTGEYAFFNNTLNLNFRKMDADKRMAINALLQSEVVVCVKDANGTAYFMGMEDYVSSISATFDTGSARTDNNSMAIALQDTTSELPLQISASCWEAIKANSVA